MVCLLQASLINANLQVANLGYTNLQEASFLNANLQGAIVESSVWFEKYDFMVEKPVT